MNVALVVTAPRFVIVTLFVIAMGGCQEQSVRPEATGISADFDRPIPLQVEETGRLPFEVRLQKYLDLATHLNRRVKPHTKGPPLSRELYLQIILAGDFESLDAMEPKLGNRRELWWALEDSKAPQAQQLFEKIVARNPDEIDFMIRRKDGVEMLLGVVENRSTEPYDRVRALIVLKDHGNADIIPRLEMLLDDQTPIPPEPNMELFLGDAVVGQEYRPLTIGDRVRECIRALK